MSNSPHPAHLLKNATRQAHQTTEELTYAEDIVTGQLSLDNYTKILATQRALHHSVAALTEKAQLSEQHPLATFIDSHCVKAVDKDLSFLNYPIRELTPPAFLTGLPVQNTATLCGIFYVLEGSRLGARLILKKLPKSEELKHIPHFHFYEHQLAGRPAARWKQFLKTTNQILNTSERIQMAIHAARQTFAAYAYFMKKINENRNQ